MTLVSERIESVARKIYEETFTKPHIPEDIHSDIYLQFIVRMKKYRDRHPEVKKVTDGFVARCAGWIVKNLAAKDRRGKRRQDILAKVCTELLSECPLNEKESFDQKTLNALFAYIGNVSSKKTYRTYTLVFLLYYACYLPDSFMAGATVLIGTDKQQLLAQARTIRTQVTKQVADSMQEKMNIAAGYYYRLVDLQSRKDMKDSGEIKQATARLKKSQAIALEKLKHIAPVPSYTEIAECCRMHPNTVRYGFLRFREGLRKELETNR